MAADTPETDPTPSDTPPHQSETSMKPDILDPTDGVQQTENAVSEPTKLIRIASMTKAMLEEVRHAPLDEAGRARLSEIHHQSLAELRGVLSPELASEFDEIFRPMNTDDIPSESLIRIAQAQLIGWLEGLFHGIQATLFTQQMAARAQLEEMQRRQLGPVDRDEQVSGLYL